MLVSIVAGLSLHFHQKHLGFLFKKKKKVCVHWGRQTKWQTLSHYLVSHLVCLVFPLPHSQHLLLFSKFLPFRQEEGISFACFNLNFSDFFFFVAISTFLKVIYSFIKWVVCFLIL